MSERVVQKILFLFGGSFLLTGIWMISLEMLGPAVAVFAFATLLISVAGVGPTTIDVLSAKLGSGNGAYGFDRYLPSGPEREIALKISQDHPSLDIATEEQDFLIEAEKRPPKIRAPEDYLALATKKWRARDYDGSLADVFSGLALNQEEVRIKAALIHRKGSIYECLGLKDQGIEFYKEAISLDPTFDWPHNSLGNLYSLKGQSELAEQEFKRAIELNPHYSNTHHNLGVFYQKQGKLEDAELQFKEAIELDPQYANPHNGLGNLLRGQKKFKVAEGEYKKAIELNPKYPNPHNNLGSLYAIQGKLQEAKMEYEEALRLDPNYDRAKENLEKLQKRIELKNRELNAS